MVKKKVLVHGSLKSLNEFFSSPFSAEFSPLAILTDEPEKITVSIRKGVDTESEVLATENLPRFALPLIDGIVLTEFESCEEMIDRLLQMGIEPRKIILWNNRGVLKYFDTNGNDGEIYIFMEGLQFSIREEKDIPFFNQILDILQNQRQFYTLNPKYYPELVMKQYKNILGKPLNLDNPQTWTEKMQWLKLYDVTPLKTRLADKYLVRQWVSEKIGEQYLIPLYGVWNDFDEIDFDALPNQFVLKCNHGCGMNIICRDKKDFDIDDAREKLTAWLSVDYGTLSFELQYSGIKRKIIAEKFMTNGKNLDLKDYKFWCFNGEVVYCKLITGRSTDERLDYFDLNWNHMDFEQSNCPNSEHPEKILKPKNFELMKELAAELCKGFYFVRVDFYEIDGKVYFGEMTFTPSAGRIRYNSKGTDEYLGKLLTLPTPPTASYLTKMKTLN